MDTPKRKPGRPKSEQPIKDKLISFRMDESEYQHLKEFSESQGTTVADTINEAIKANYEAKSK